MGNLLAQYYEHSYTLESSHAQPETVLVIGGMFLLFGLIFSLALYVIQAFFLSKIFQKAGIEPWKAWVPVYNHWILLELGGQKGFWAVLLYIPIIHLVATIFTYIATYEIGLKLGKQSAFVLLAIFLPPVWLGWLAFDTSKWQHKAKKHEFIKIADKVDK